MSRTKFEKVKEQIDDETMFLAILAEKHKQELKESTERYRVLREELRKLCPHTSVTHHEFWNYHKNVDDSYDECNTCGKWKSYGSWD